MNMREEGTANREAALAAFDHARDGFLAAFAAAPDEALGYLPPGDEYALGVLPLHLRDSMRHYLDVLDRVERASFGPVNLIAASDATQAEAEQRAEMVTRRPTGAERAQLVGDLLATHREVQARAQALDAGMFDRQAPVIYSAGTEPYPTSCRDILSWVTEHYDEHTQQVGELLARWRAGGE